MKRLTDCRVVSGDLEVWFEAGERRLWWMDRVRGEALFVVDGEIGRAHV